MKRLIIRYIALVAVWFLTISIHDLYAQQISISGRIVDAMDSSPLPGAVVLQKGTKNGSITNLKGEFTLSAPQGAMLEVSYLGYTTIEVIAEKKMTISLKADKTALDAVVVTGYAAERAVEITGAVTVVNMEEIADVSTGNIMTSLSGRVPGVNITTDGTPGGVSTSMLVRGTTTINDSSPLYVIDGVPTRVNMATIINANDVESIQVLKDAASASIYGAQAANGVIIITTKKARNDELTISFDTRLSVQTFDSYVPLLNAQEWGEVYWEAYNNDGLVPAHSIYGYGETPVIPEWLDRNKTIPSADTNWQKELHQTSFNQDYTLSLHRGAKNGSTTASINFINEDGIIKWTRFTRYNARVASDYRFFSNKLRIGENIMINYWNQVYAASGVEELAIAQHPMIPVKDINGNYAGPTVGLGDKRNPVAVMDQYKDSNTDNYRLFGNAYVEVEPLKNLVFRTALNIDFYNIFSKTFNGRWQEGYFKNEENELYQTSAYDLNMTWNATGNYNYKDNNHSVNALIGVETKKYSNEDLSTYKKDFFLEDPNYVYMSAGEGDAVVNGVLQHWAMFSVFGKLNYGFRDRYLVSFTLRRDASSRFGKNNRAGYFPAVSVGWRLTEEPWMKKALGKSQVLNNLKFRASYGINGNDMINNHATYDMYNLNLVQGGYDFKGANTGNITTGAIKTLTGNPNLKWERTDQFNIGLDLAMFRNRLTLTVDAYSKYTTNMLQTKAFLATMGEGATMYSNGAMISNIGLEGILSWTDYIGKKFKYSATFNLSYYENRVRYDENAQIQYGQSIEGFPMGVWYGWKTDGLFRTEKELNNGINQPGKGLGRIRYQDLNGDKVINDLDQTWIGHPNPKFIGGLNIWMGYGSFDLSLFFSGMVRQAWNSQKNWTDFSTFWGNHGRNLLKAWNPNENFNSDIPALSVLNLNNERRSSDYFIEDGSYIKLKVLTLGWNLPYEWAQKCKMKGLRLYIQGQNLFTITKYSGPDPEVLNYSYPMPKQFVFGASVTF